MFNDLRHSKLALGIGLFLTFGITLIKGGTLPWVSLFWAALCCIALCIVLLLHSNSNVPKRSGDHKTSKDRLFTAFSFVAFQVWVLVQHFVISLDKTASLNQLFVGLGMTSLLVIWYYALRCSGALNTLYTVFISFALIQSVYGVWVYLSDADQLLWMPKIYYLDRPTGFFVNANHFAAYLSLAIILCLSHIISSKPATIRKNGFFRLLDNLYNPTNLVLCILILVLIASKSFGAMAALGTVFAIILLNTIKRAKPQKSLIIGVVALICVILFFALALDYSLVEKEIAGLSHTFSRRIALSKAAFGMLKDTWLFGVGGGAFYSQFSAFRTLEIGNNYYNYAHNDLLQFWIEYGVIGISLLLLFVASALRDNMCALRKKNTQIQVTFAYASIFSTLALAVHSLVDFPLHIPGLSVSYLVLISVNSLSMMNSKPSEDVDTKNQ